MSSDTGLPGAHTQPSAAGSSAPPGLGCWLSQVISESAEPSQSSGRRVECRPSPQLWGPYGQDRVPYPGGPGVLPQSQPPDGDPAYVFWFRPEEGL